MKCRNCAHQTLRLSHYLIVSLVVVSAMPALVYARDLLSKSSISCLAAVPSTLDRAGTITLATNVANGAGSVYFEGLATGDCFTPIVHRITSLGDSVLYVDKHIGFISAHVTLPHVLVLAEEKGFENTTVENVDSHQGAADAYTRQKTVPLDRVPIEPVAHNTSKLVPPPFFPALEAGLTSLGAIGGDGRGARIGLMQDEGIDLFHPELGLAKDIDGHFIPKVFEIMPYFPWAHSNEQWIQPEVWATATEHRITAFGRTWETPYDAYFALAHVYHDFSSSLDQRLYSGVVLIDFTRQLLWLDPSFSGNFSAIRPVHNYRSPGDVGAFRVRSNSRDNRIPYFVFFDMPRHAVDVVIPPGYHGTLVTGTMAGNTYTGGLFSGAAPASQIVEVQKSGAPWLIDWLYVLRHNVADVFNQSGLIYESRYIPVSDVAESAMRKAIAFYNKPVFCFCAFPGTVNISDFQSERELRINRRLIDVHSDYIHPMPLLMGGPPYNMVLVPSVSLTSVPHYSSVFSDPYMRRIAGDATLAPEGYAIGNNPSPTVSLASGAAAVLVQLGRKDHVSFDAFRLQQVLLLSARSVPGYPTWQEGVGALQTDRAWQLLKDTAELREHGHIATRFVVTNVRDGNENGALSFSGWHGNTAGGELRLQAYDAASPLHDYTLNVIGDPGFHIWPAHIRFGSHMGALIHYRVKTKNSDVLAFLVIRDAQSAVPLQLFPLQYIGLDRAAVSAPGMQSYFFAVPPRRLRQILSRVDPSSQLVAVSVDVPGIGVRSARDRLALFSQAPAVYDFTSRNFTRGILQLSVLQLWMERLYGNMKKPTTSAASTLLTDIATNDGALGTTRHYFTELRMPTADRIGIQVNNRAFPEYEVPGLPPLVSQFRAQIIVRNFSVAIHAIGNKVQIINTGAGNVPMRLARMSSLETPLQFDTVGENMETAQFSIQKASVEVHVDVRSSDNRDRADIVLFRCVSSKNDCHFVETGTLGEPLTLYTVAPNDYRIVVLPHTAFSGTITGESVAIGAELNPAEPWHVRRSGERWIVSDMEADTRNYAALQVLDDKLNPNPPFLSAVRVK